MPEPITVQSLDHLVLSVSDLGTTLAFYTRGLGMMAEEFRPDDGSIRHALKFGTQKINLHDASAPFAPHAAHPSPGTADLCFLTDTPLVEWQAHFAKTGIAVEQGPVRRTGATGEILSLYVRDPDENLIEISNRV